MTPELTALIQALGATTLLATTACSLAVAAGLLRADAGPHRATVTDVRARHREARRWLRAAYRAYRR